MARRQADLGRGVAKLLKPYSVRPAQDRHGSFYRPSDFADAFARYLSSVTETNATSTTSATPSATAVKKGNGINGDGSCGGYGTYNKALDEKHRNGSWEGEI